MAFIRKVKTTSGATAVQVAYSSYGKIIKIEHIGSAHTDEKLQFLLALAKQRLIGLQQGLLQPSADNTDPISLRRSFSGLLLEVLAKQYDHLGFTKLKDKAFESLCLARLVEPTSKLDSLRVFEDLGINRMDEDQLYRCLKDVIGQDYRTKIEELCFAGSSSRGISLILYDVTTLYFEVQKEDDYRKSGMSKERRLEPQIVVGLLVDQDGFPLGLQSFEGDKPETKTILPVLEEFKKKHQLKDITVIADAGMLSQNNLQALVAAGYSYVVGSRMSKVPYDIGEYQKTGELSDNQIITSNTETAGQRIVYQYRAKRAALDLRNIEKQIAKAEKIVSGQAIAKKAKFLSATTKDKQLNQKLIDKAKALVGIKGYVTNLDVPDKEIINYYHQLWQVERSFRMSKSDLRARPIFHHKRDSIEAHLTIVLTALAVARTIERKTGITIKRLVKTLRPIRSGIVVIDGKEYFAEAEIPPVVENLLGSLEPQSSQSVKNTLG